jgi:hypothetical protein
MQQFIHFDYAISRGVTSAIGHNRPVTVIERITVPWQKAVIAREAYHAHASIELTDTNGCRVEDISHDF